MKKVYCSILMIAVCVFAASCQKDDMPSSKGARFSFKASAPVTRTALDGMNTTWEASDAINVWNAEAGGSVYSSNQEFSTSTAGQAAVFAGTLETALDAEAAYDWYLSYPYSDALSSPAASVMTLAAVDQVQNDYDSMEAMTGPLCPAYGVAKNVKGNAALNVSMQNLSCGVKVVVTNSSSDPLIVRTVRFIAPEGSSIAGDFTVDLTADPVSITPSAASDTVFLHVTTWDKIAVGGSKSFFLTCSPFTAANGSTIKIQVNGQEKSYVMPSAKELVAGKIKTFNFNYTDSAPTPKWSKIEDLNDINPYTPYIIVCGNGCGQDLLYPCKSENDREYYYLGNESADSEIACNPGILDEWDPSDEGFTSWFFKEKGVYPIKIGKVTSDYKGYLIRNQQNGKNLFISNGALQITDPYKDSMGEDNFYIIVLNFGSYGHCVQFFPKKNSNYCLKYTVASNLCVNLKGNLGNVGSNPPFTQTNPYIYKLNTGE